MDVRHFGKKISAHGKMQPLGAYMVKITLQRILYRRLERQARIDQFIHL